jgi:pyruvate/2-oxoglutarate dehydrogenase complex dihydrolipoamide acyltransferase (E2) component
MKTTLRIPKAAVSMQEGMITSWLATDGALVKEGDPLYTLEIEKSTLDIQSPANGTLKQLVAAGLTLKVGEVIGEIEG